MIGVVDVVVVVVGGGGSVVVVVVGGGGAAVVVVVGGTVVVVVGGTVVVVGGFVVVVVGGFVVVVVVGWGCLGRVVVVVAGGRVVVVVGTTGSGIGTNGSTMVVGEMTVVADPEPERVTTGAIAGPVTVDGDVRTVGFEVGLLCERRALVGATDVVGGEVDGGGTSTGSGASVVVVVVAWFDPVCESSGDSPKFSGPPRCPTTRNATPAVMATMPNAKISGPR